MMQIAVCDDEVGTCSEIETMVLDFANSHAVQMETEVFYTGKHCTASCKTGISLTLFFWIFS